MTLNQRVVGSIHIDAWHFLSFSKTLNPHLLLSTQVYKWVPGRMRTIIVSEFANATKYCVQLGKECSPGSGNCTISVAWKCIPWPGVIIIVNVKRIEQSIWLCAIQVSIYYMLDKVLKVYRTINVNNERCAVIITSVPDQSPDQNLHLLETKPQ